MNIEREMFKGTNAKKKYLKFTYHQSLPRNIQIINNSIANSFVKSKRFSV